jgi:putative ABC transport system permease protein
MDTLVHDLRYALRALARARGFALTAILTLGLGIGLTTAIYSVVAGVVLRALPFPEPDRFVIPRSIDLTTDDQWSVTYADYRDWLDAQVFEHVGVYQGAEADLAGSGDPLRVSFIGVSEGFFGALSVMPALGRTLQPSDNALTAPRVIVVAHSLWRSRFGGDSSVLGREVRINGLPRTIVGVLPPDSEWPAGGEVWAPMKISDPNEPNLRRRDNFIFRAVARLAPGSSIEGTRSRLATIARRVAEEEPVIRQNISVTVVPAAEELLGDTLPRVLWILLGAVGFVLVIGCVNIANLMLARTTVRVRELAVRAALGASRARIIRQMLTESVVIALIGGTIGVLLAYWSVDVLVAGAPTDVPRLDDVTVSLPVLGVALGLSITSALLFGLAPAVSASGVHATTVMAEGSQRIAGGRAARRRRGTLVVLELALALVLLAGAGLLTRSFVRLQGTNPGVGTDRIVTMSVSLPGARYQSGSSVRHFYRRASEELAALPGVEAASVTSALPVGGGGFYLGRSFLAEGWAPPPASTEVDGQWNVVGPDYFRAMGVPLLRGREFTVRDDSASTPVMIVNATFAERMFPGENPLGKRALSSRDEKLLREIVGVVGDVRYFDAADTLRALVYVPHAQNSWSSMRIVLRTVNDPRSIVDAARRVIGGIDPELAVASVATMDEVLRTSLGRPRFTTMLLGVFAGVALLLVAVGLYGVLAYGIAQRTHEIGIRMALGARASHVLGMVAREAAMLIGLGLLLGAAGAVAVSRVMENILFETSATDPVTFAVVVVILSAVGAVAAYFPARRATRVDPVITLRTEE